MSRHPEFEPSGSSARDLRLGALVLVLVAVGQINDPLVDPTLAQQLWYWSARVAVLALGLWSADALVAKTLAARWRRPRWLCPVIVVSALGLLPFALAELLMEPLLPMRPEFADDELRASSPVLAYLSEYATVLSILVPAHLLLWLILERRPASSGPGVADEPGPGDNSATTPMLPPFLRGAQGVQAQDVLAFSAEEHYVRIYTRAGESLVHYRFGDAVQEMPTALGLRVHRSWWVAGDAVVGATRGARRWQLMLPGDLRVPVSDSYVQVVRERGWLHRKARDVSAEGAAGAD